MVRKIVGQMNFKQKFINTNAIRVDYMTLVLKKWPLFPAKYSLSSLLAFIADFRIWVCVFFSN